MPRRKVAKGVWTCGRFTIRRFDVPGKTAWWWEVFRAEERVTPETFVSLTLAHMWCRRNNP